MKVMVRRLWENGKPIPLWRRGQTDLVKGELRLTEERDPMLNRTVRAAHLFVHKEAPTVELVEVLSPLSDASVVWMGKNQMTITGVERCDIFPTYAQTWLVEVISLHDPAIDG